MYYSLNMSHIYIPLSSWIAGKKHKISFQNWYSSTVTAYMPLWQTLLLYATELRLKSYSYRSWIYISNGQ